MAVYHSKPYKSSDCSWRVSLLATIVVIEELVIVRVLFVLSLFVTFPLQSLRKILTRRPSTRGHDVAGAIGARRVCTPLGTVPSASCGCATQNFVMLNTYQNKIYFSIVTKSCKLIICFVAPTTYPWKFQYDSNSPLVGSIAYYPSNHFECGP